MAGLMATAQIDIDAAPEAVWGALTDPAQIARYLFGSVVETDWRPGSPITWSGEYEGNPYTDKGTILEVEPGRRLVMTHFSPMTGQPDVPENYHTVTYELSGTDRGSHLSVSQDNNGSPDEAERSKGTWAAVIGGLKEVVEAG